MRSKELGDVDEYIRTEGPRLRSRLIDANPLLRPDALRELIPAYDGWYLHRHGYRLWSTSETLLHVLRHSFFHPKVKVGLSGVSAGGKDAAREEMERIAPGFVRRVVTATSRPPKPGEQDRADYYFYPGPEAFDTAVADGAFIEHVTQGDRRYGLPKRSIDDALTGTEPFVVTHVEMFSGWPRLAAHLETTYAEGNRPFFLRVFILPEMRARDYFLDWLPSHRPPGEVESRANRAAVEIWEAPQCAHFLITNVMSADQQTIRWEAVTLLRYMNALLRPGIPAPVLPDVPDLGVGWLPNVPAAQDTIWNLKAG